MLSFMYCSEYSDYLTESDKMSASLNYREVLSDCTFSLDDFESLLSEEDEWDLFLTSIENLRSGWVNLEEVAYRWAIPVIMVKYYYNFL